MTLRPLIVVVSCFTGALGAQESILEKLSAETTNVLVVRDPLPLLEQVLDSPLTKRVLDDTAELQRAAFGRVFTAAALQQQLALVRALIPTEVVVAAPTRTFDRLLHVAPLAACLELLQMLGRAGSTDAALNTAIQATAKRCLEHFDNLPLQAWVKARDERTAEQWFESLGDALRENAAVAGIELKFADDRIEVRGQPFKAGGRLAFHLGGRGVDASAAPVWELSATIELREAAIALQVGKLAPPPCMAERLGPAWRHADAALFFARIETGDAGPSFTEAYAHLAEVAQLDLAAADGANMPRLYTFLARADALGADQSWRFAVDRGLLWTHETYGEHLVPKDEVVPPALLRLATAAEGPYFVTADTLDAFAVNTFETLLPESPEPYSVSTMVRMTWEPVLAFLDGEESAVFAPGVLALVRPATLRAMQGVTGPMPFLAGALVAHPKSPDDGAAFMNTLASHIAEATGIGTPLWSEQDLGLGTKTHALRLDEIAPLLRQQGVDADFAPHWFVTDELFVVSTDPKLSKDLLARAVSAKAPEPGKPLLQRLHLRGTALVDLAAALKAWTQIDGVLAQQLQNEVMRSVDALQAVGNGIEHFEMRAEIDGKVLRDTTTLRLREAPPPK